MRRMFKAQVISYLTYGSVNIKYALLGHVYHFRLDILLCRCAGLFFDKVAKIIG